jgi:DNA-directed RNA polymerase subunit beta'
MFNDILPEGDGRSTTRPQVGDWPRHLRLLPAARPPATIDLLDDMKELGFREATRSGLSFATDDLVTPPTRPRSSPSREGGDEVQEALPSAASSPRASATTRCSTPGRTPAKQITKRDDDRHGDDDARGGGYVNPMYLMATPAPAAASSRSASWPACAA